MEENQKSYDSSLQSLSTLLDLENISTHNLYIGFNSETSYPPSGASSIYTTDTDSHQSGLFENNSDDEGGTNSVANGEDKDKNPTIFPIATNISTTNMSTNATSPQSTTSNHQRLPSQPSTIPQGSSEIDYSSLDRYGFIVVGKNNTCNMTAASNSSQKNLLLGPNKVFRLQRFLPGNLSTLDYRYDGTEESGNDERRYKRLREENNQREARRALKWIKMLRQVEGEKDVAKWPSLHPKLEERMIKGIPDCLRTKVWTLFIMESTDDPKLHISYNYRDLYLRISGFERQIDLDIERTLRDHVMFKIRFSSAQISLFKMLVAYSNYDPEVGYCQGMSNVAAFFLLYFEEETAFALFVKLMSRNRLRMLYMTGFSYLFESFFVQEKLMSKLIPELESRLCRLGIMPSVYATKWYLTLFLNFSVSLSNRIWDLFLFYGFDFLIVVAVALLKYFESRLLLLDYEPTMQFLSRLPDEQIDETKLMKLAISIWRRLVPSYTYYRTEQSINKHDIMTSMSESLEGQTSSEPNKLWKVSVFTKLRQAYNIIQAQQQKHKKKAVSTLQSAQIPATANPPVPPATTTSDLTTLPSSSKEPIANLTKGLSAAALNVPNDQTILNGSCSNMEMRLEPSDSEKPIDIELHSHPRSDASDTKHPQARTNVENKDSHDSISITVSPVSSLSPVERTKD